MATSSSKIRVGIVGANPQRGFASVAHIPALQALPDFEITAVCTSRQDSAEAAARHLGARLAFSDCEKLAQHSDVDLVTVSVKVPDHYRPVMAAIEAGKHVYSEWPLGRDTAEAVRLRDAANARGIRHAVGLQGQMSPPINYLKDLIAEGYVGRILSATMVEEAGKERAYGQCPYLGWLRLGLGFGIDSRRAPKSSRPRILSARSTSARVAREEFASVRATI